VHVVSADQPLPTDAAHRRAFLAAFLRRPGTMGAVVPSSTRLSAVLASIVPTAGAPVVVELMVVVGGGRRVGGVGCGAAGEVGQRVQRGAEGVRVKTSAAGGDRAGGCGR